MQHTLKELLSDLSCNLIQGSGEIELTGICMDSRKVKPGNLFICISG